EKSTQPVALRLKTYAEINGKIFVHLRRELVFYLGALRFIQTLEKLGLPTCRPEIAPREERICQVEAAYNANLALHLGRYANGHTPAKAVTQNDVLFGEPGRIFILTGPNQGGKTTYMQGVALLQVLAQVGCWVPGRRARLSPVDQILTHFPSEEKPEADAGRFGEEAQRLGALFQQVTSSSLVLLNESLASTSAGESVYIAQDIIRILRRLGASVIFATHLHELADRIDEMNAATPGDSRIASLVSSPVKESSPADGDHPRSYKVELRPPLGQSYAREIAARYGVSYEQLEKGLIERGQLDDGKR
ncbi:MAG TPA: hypothetical protein VHO48_08080, partial [Anaerolineaceae bacterium]|nr:hypothetical protein [Anaerolineaceae bacterium]